MGGTGAGGHVIKALAIAALLLAFVTGVLLGRATADGAELTHAETPALWVAVHPTTTTTATVVEATTTSVPGEVPVGPCGGLEHLFAMHWPTDEVPTACRVAECESRFDPNAVSATSDHGIFQLHAPLWVEPFERVTGQAFYPGVYDPALNARFASWLWAKSGWQPWNASKGCWG